MGESRPILITGGAGFIGSHIADLLEEEAKKFLIVDNLSSGTTENIVSSVNSGSFIRGDVNDYYLMRNLISSSCCVIHLASTVGVRNVINHPLGTIDTNINSLEFIARESARFKIPLIFFSSSLVYSSNNGNGRFSESDQVHSLGFHPVSMYTSSKKIGELICEYFRETAGLQYIIIRPFNIIGIRQRSDSGMVVPAFIKSALYNKCINVYGDGQQTRVFSDVKTAVRLLWQLMREDKNYGHIFNLAASDQSISMLELAKIIKDIIDEPISINYLPYRKIFGDRFVDVQSRSPSLEKIKAYTDFREQRDLTIILKEIVEYEKNIYLKESIHVQENNL